MNGRGNVFHVINLVKNINYAKLQEHILDKN